MVTLQQAAELVRQGDLARLERLPEGEVAQLASKVDEDERTLLHSAAATGNLPITQLFLRHSSSAAAVNRADDEGWTPVQSAASAGHDSIVEALVSAGADVNSANSSGRTALHYAASKGRPSMISLLLQKGAAVDARDDLGATPLHRACSAGKTAAVRELVERGHARLDIKDKQAEDRQGETPLSAAAAFAGLREALVDLVTGKTSIEDMLEE